MPAPIKCIYCRDNIEPVDSKWVGQVSRKPYCKIAPDHKHARQIVLNRKVA